MVESYNQGKGLMAGTSVPELARRAIEDFAATEKKFLDLASHEINAAAEAAKEGRRLPKERSKALGQLAREGVEKYTDAQKKLFDLAIRQFEHVGKIAERNGHEVEEARTTLAELTQKSVKNFVSAQKSLMDLAIKPVLSPDAAGASRPAGTRPRRRAAAKRASV
jgi:hypothetical protein